MGTQIKKHISWWLAIFFACAYGLVLILSQQSPNPDQLANDLQQKIQQQQHFLDDCTEKVNNILQSKTVKEGWPQLERVVKKHPYTFLQIFRNDSLVFWNTNMLSIPNDYDSKQTYRVIRDKTAWYLTRYYGFQNYDIFVYQLIRKDFSINNEYLPTYENTVYGDHANLSFSLDKTDLAYPINSHDGSYLMSVSFSDTDASNETIIYLLFVLMVLVYVCVLNGMYRLYAKVLPRGRIQLWRPIFFIADVIILRLLDYYLAVPAKLKTSFLFEPGLQLMPYFESIGDLSLNVVLMCVIAVRIYKSARKEHNLTQESKTNLYKSLLSTLVFWLVSLWTFLLIYLLIIHSQCGGILNFSFEDFSCVLLLLDVILLSVFLYLSTDRLLSNSSVSLAVLISHLLLAVLIVFLPNSWWFSNQWMPWILIGFIALSLLNAKYLSKRNTGELSRNLRSLVLFSVVIALLVNLGTEERKDQEQAETLYDLAHAREPQLEEQFDVLMGQMHSDTMVQHIIDHSGRVVEDLDAHLQKNYFKGFWKKFSIQMTLCDSSDLIEIQPDGLIVGCEDYFETMVSQEGKPTLSEHLFLIDDEPEHIYYIGKLNFHSGSKSLVLYMDFVSSLIPEGLGYPELLVDQSTALVDLSGYSFANYFEGKLSYKFGTFAYHTHNEYLKDYGNEHFFNLDQFRHLKIPISENNILIISRPRTKLAEHLVVFSILFILFTLIVLFVFLFSWFFSGKMEFNMSLGNRLQTVFMVFITFIILSMAFLTLFYVEMNNQSSREEQLNERTYSVFIELQHKLASKPEAWADDPEMLHALLRKFSLVFFSDIHLYNKHGYLIATSRPEVVTNGFISEFVNPMAYEELFVKNKLFYITEEKIGTLEYLSSYIPLTLQDDEPVGIINLPYFARQSEEQLSYYRMLFTFINLFVIFGIIGTFVALLFSKYLTKPLRVLEENIVAIQIDKKNKRMRWNSRDEIGQLIEAYNGMVDKLEQSAELIKHSERESAWREVARQIAHEIRNPLTPMKLNVQYLEKAYNEKDAAFDEKMKSISASLIQQINSLDKVAEMFSDFAKMNERKFHRVDLKELIQSAISLFENQEGLTLSFEYDEDRKHWLTLAFEKDLIRVFNNLIKNAIQAKEAKATVRVQIRLEAEEAFYAVSISDDGKGIAEAAKPKVFQPYFTTKTAGTGLGLAIVKNIMNEVGGEIGFESELGQGSRFILKFKAASAEETSRSDS